MPELQFTLKGSTLNSIFPFYLLIDEHLIIKSFGESISKMKPELTAEEPFTKHFTIVRPFKNNIKPQNFKALLNQLVVFTSKGKNIVTLRGQFEPHENGFLFVGSPWFMSMQEVDKSQLTAKDFAHHDPLIDILQVLKNQETTNKELKELIVTTEFQRKKLKDDKEELDKLSLVASANKDGVVFTHPQGEIFWCNESFMNLTGLGQKEIIGKTLTEVGCGKQTNKEEVFKMLEAFYNGSGFEVEYIHLKKKGDPFQAKITGQPIMDDAGFVSQYFAIIEDITFEKEREQQLLLLSSIAEKNTNSVIITNEKGETEWVNSSFLEMTGYSLSELIGKKPGNLLQGPESDPTTIAFLRNQIKNGIPFSCEIINYTKSKEKYWVRIQGQALHNKYGEVIKFFATQEDITFEKEFNQQLIESENRLNSIIANLQSGILLEDEARKIVFVNKKFCELFDIEVEPELMKGFDCNLMADATKDFFAEPDTFLKRISEILEKKDIVIAEEISIADGRIFERSFIPIINGEKYDGHLWNYEDITIKKKHKEILETEREKYSNIIANMNMGLLEVDNSDQIQLANQSFLDMSGYEIKELIGRKASDLFLKNKNKQVMNEKINIRKNNISDSYQMSITTKKGDEKYWLISGAPNYNVNGEITGSIGIHLDITEQKKNELQKEHLLNKLEKQNENLNEYAQMVSHDLKSPLRSIYTLITWIKEDNDKEFNVQTKQYLEMIEDKVEKMDYLIQGILTYSKIDSTKLSNELINLNDIVKNIIRIIDIPPNVSVTIANELPTKKADKFRMQQLFQNLISNAVNYNDKEKGIVTIGCNEDDNNYTFYVADNGPGIDTKYHNKIFKIFESFIEKEKSTGIGLSIVKRIVNNYNGKIWIESELGIGTTFFIKLPKKHGTT